MIWASKKAITQVRAIVFLCTSQQKVDTFIDLEGNRFL